MARDRERLPNSKASNATICTLESIKRLHNISFARALELVCLESVTFNNHMDELRKRDSKWFNEEADVLRAWARSILEEDETGTC